MLCSSVQVLQSGGTRKHHYDLSNVRIWHANSNDWLASYCRCWGKPERAMRERGEDVDYPFSFCTNFLARGSAFGFMPNSLTNHTQIIR